MGVHFADVAELVDAPDLESGSYGVQVQFLSSAVSRVFLEGLKVLMRMHGFFFFCFFVPIKFAWETKYFP